MRRQLLLGGEKGLMEKYLFGSSKAVKVEVQNHRKIVLCGPIKEVSNSLQILSMVFGDRPIGSITDAELAVAMEMVERMRRRICGK